MKTTRNPFSRRLLSVALTLVMVIAMIPAIPAMFGQKAFATNYEIQAIYACSDAGSIDDQNKGATNGIVVYYPGGSVTMFSWDDIHTAGNNASTITSATQTISGYPTSFEHSWKNWWSWGGGASISFAIAIQLKDISSGEWVTIGYTANSCNDNSSHSTGDVGCTVYAGGASVSGADSVVLPVSGGASSTYSAAFTDIAGGSLSQTPTWSVNSSNASVSNGTVTFAHASSDYSVTVTATSSTVGTSGSAVSGSKTVMVYAPRTVTFVGKDGETLKTESVPYGGSATPPSTPLLKDADKHYTFLSWSGSYTGVTSDQTVTAVYNTEQHTYGEWSEDSATCLQGGSQSRTCSLAACGHVETRSTDPKGHTWCTTADANHLISGADCETPATYHTWCSVCGENHPTETFTAGTPTGHDYTGAIHPLADGLHHNWACANGCGTYGKVDNGTQVKDGCVDCPFGDWYVKQGETCFADGTLARDCACGHQQTQPIPAHHTMEKIDAVTPDCENGGNNEYWHCTVCGDYFADEAGATATTPAEQALDPLGHEFKAENGVRNVEPGKHNFKCTRCEAWGVGDVKDATEDCYGAPATCAAASVCTVCGVSYGGVDPANHDWDYANAAYHWDGYTCAEATVRCKNEPSHTLSITDITVTSATTDETCTEDGETVYTATFTVDGTPYSGTKTQILPARGHDFTPDASRVHSAGSGVHNWKCVRCEAYGTGSGASAEVGGTEACGGTATCVAPALCPVCGQSHGGIDPANHDWDYANAAYHWDGYTCAEATVRCKHEPTHTLPITDITVTSATTDETCTEDGETVYTATFTVDGTPYSGTKTQVLPARVHDFSADPARVHDNGDGTHNWKCAKCAAYGIVEDGAQTEGGSVSCEATYGDWSADTADCENGGSQTRTCSVCGHTETRATDPLDHNWVSVYNENAEENHKISGADCEHAAEYHVYCSRCGADHATQTFSHGSPLFHDFSADEGRVNNLRNGSHNWKCARCDAYGIVTDGEQVKDGSVSCEATYGDWSDDTATCENGGSHSRACAVCGYVQTESTPALNHDFDESIPENVTYTYLDGLCVNGGTKTVKCSRCDETEETSVPAWDEHDFDESIADNIILVPATCVSDGSRSVKCSRCDATKLLETIVSAGQHDFDETIEENILAYTPETCTTDGSITVKCRLCEAQNTRTIPAAHDFSVESIAEGALKTAATCVAPAVYYKSCSRCPAVSSSEEDTFTFGEPDPNAHDFDDTVEGNVRDVYTNCAEGGTRYVKCSRCDAEQESALPALDHSFTAETVKDDARKSAANCVSPAVYYYSCTRCGAVENDADHTFTNGETNPGNHDFDASIPANVREVYADCTNGGMKYVKCSRCDAEQESALPALDHSFTAETVKDDARKSAANCVSPAVYYYSCTRCGAVENDADHTFTNGETNPGNHDFDASIPANVREVYADCTNGGMKYVKCSRCDAEQESALPALDHSFTAETVKESALVSGATCTDRAVYYKSCARCGAVGDTATFEAGGLLSHDFTAERAEGRYLKSEATCQSAAVYYRSCAVCGAVTDVAYDTFLYGEPADHSFTAERAESGYLKSAATCTEKAVYWKSCAVCGLAGDTETFTSGAARGHDFNASIAANVTTNPATCTAAGSKTIKCSRCAETKTTTLPALGHDFSEWFIAVPATESQPGVERRECSRCDAFEERELEDAVNGEGARTIKFNNINKMHYILQLGGGNEYRIYNSSAIQWYANKPLTFTVYTYSSFNYSDYIVYINGKAAHENADGSYTIPAGEGNVVVTVAGAVKDDSAPTGKLSFWELLIRFFQRIIAVFTGKK